MSRRWFAVKAQVGGVAEIAIFSDIGDFGVSAQDFYSALKALGPVQELQVRISSNGGDVFQGFAIYNMLSRFPARKVVTIEGVAASMASLIAMAGDEVVMPSNALIMIHNPIGFVAGESEQIASFAEAMKTMRASIIDGYVKKSKKTPKQISDLMDRETWLGAEEAVAQGFADRVEQPMKMAAKIDTTKFKSVPASLDALLGDDMEKTAEQIAADEAAAAKAVADAAAKEAADKAAADAAAKAAADEAAAKAVADAAAKEVADKAAADAAAKAAAETEIRALCKLAKKDAQADKFIAAGMSVDQVKVALDVVPADETTDTRNQREKKDGLVIDPVGVMAHWNKRAKDKKAGTEAGDQDTEQTAVLDPAAIFARMNKRRVA